MTCDHHTPRVLKHLRQERITRSGSSGLEEEERHVAMFVGVCDCGWKTGVYVRRRHAERQAAMHMWETRR